MAAGLRTHPWGSLYLKILQPVHWLCTAALTCLLNHVGPFKKLNFLDPVQCLYWESGMDKECGVGLGPGTFIDAFHKVPQVFLT